MAALHDTRKTGADLTRAMEALLHSTPGLKPGYLPEKDANDLLVGSLHLLTLASYLDAHSAQLRREALSRMQVALTGSPPNCLHSLLKANFGYASSSTTNKEDRSFHKRPATSEDGPPHKQPATSIPSPESSSNAPFQTLPRRKEDYNTLPTFKGSESEGTNGNFPSAEILKAVGFKPCSNPKRWSRTGLANDYEPKRVEGEETYSCPFSLCNYTPKLKFDAVATHIRRHLNIAIQCHYCDKLFWSCAGWTKHCLSTHGDLPKVPAHATDPDTFQPLAEPV